MGTITRELLEHTVSISNTGDAPGKLMTASWTHHKIKLSQVPSGQPWTGSHPASGWYNHREAPTSVHLPLHPSHLWLGQRWALRSQLLGEEKAGPSMGHSIASAAHHTL